MSGIFIKPTVAEQFRAFLARGRVLFFSAPCGCGKTALAEELLKGKAVYRLFAGEADFSGCRRMQSRRPYANGFGIIPKNALCCFPEAHRPAI